MKIFLNNKIIDENDAVISVKDRGYLFGEGIFETMRSYEGKVPFLDKHLNRMEWSATFIGIPFPHPESIRQGIQAVLTANQLKEARVKVVLTGCGTHFTPTTPTDESTVNLMIMAQKLGGSTVEDKEGSELAVLHSITNDNPPLCTMKSVSWLTKLIAMREVAEKGCDDGILLNHQGFVTETTRGNLFWIRKDTVFTPPQTAGLLGGITRQIVMALVKDNGFVMKEDIINPNELKSSDEIFLTNSVVGIEPIVEIDGNPVGEGQCGKITKQLQELYAERIQEELNL